MLCSIDRCLVKISLCALVGKTAFRPGNFQVGDKFTLVMSDNAEACNHHIKQMDVFKSLKLLQDV